MDAITNWVQSGNLVDIGIRIVSAIAIFIIGRWVAGWIARLTQKAMQRSAMDDTLVGFIGAIVRTMLLILVIIAALGALGVETTSFAALIAAAGLAVGFALEGSLGNFAAGVMILMFRPYKVGDVIDVAGHVGTVDELQIFHTRLVTPDSKAVTIPNATITAGSITNLSAEGALRVDLETKIAHGEDFGKVKDIIMNVMKNTPGVLEDPAPSVVVLDMLQGGVSLGMRPYTTTDDYWGVYHSVLEDVKMAFDKEGIGIPAPRTDIVMVKDE